MREAGGGLSPCPAKARFAGLSQGQGRPPTAPRVCTGIYRSSLSSVFLTLRGFLLATVLRPCGWGLSPAACHLGSNTGSTWPVPPGRGRPRLLQGSSGPQASPFRSVPWTRRSGDSSSVTHHEVIAPSFLSLGKSGGWVLSPAMNDHTYGAPPSTSPSGSIWAFQLLL